jgi:hypothetical protein
MIQVIHWLQTWEKQWILKSSLPLVSSTWHSIQVITLIRKAKYLEKLLREKEILP